MAYIDPDGMFGGDRMAMLSDGAKYAFPWFWCASNSMGRVELNYREFLRGPFRQFKKPPSEQQFWAWVEELHQCFLLFAYQANGHAWGQWDVSERYLPKYKAKADERTPAPPPVEFAAWREMYQKRKIEELSTKSNLFNISENFQKSAESSEIFPLGVGSGSGSGEDIPPTPHGGDLLKFPTKRRPEKRTIAEIEKALGPRLEWWKAFWDIFPCHEGKRDGMDAFERKVSSRELAIKIYKAAERYALKIRADPNLKVKYAQGWINGERWEDEIIIPPPPEQKPRKMDGLQRLIEGSEART